MSASRSYSPPLDPIYGGYPLGWAKISGAQNLSGFSQFLPGHFVVADSVSLASPDWAKLAHSIAPPLQRKPASLGFALGAAFGGLLGWKISNGSVLQLRLALTSQRFWSVFRCRGGYQPPESLLPSREKVPSVCEADEGGAGMAKAPQRAGQCPAPTKGEKRFYIRRRGGCPHPPALEGTPFVGHGLPDAPFRLPAKRRRGGTLGRPPYPTAQLGPHRNKGAFKKGSARFSTTARPAGAKDEGKAVS